MRRNCKLSFPSYYWAKGNNYFVGSQNLQLQDSSCSMFSIPNTCIDQAKEKIDLQMAQSEG
jgi:hypothetical protein